MTEFGLVLFVMMSIFLLYLILSSRCDRLSCELDRQHEHLLKLDNLLNKDKADLTRGNDCE